MSDFHGGFVERDGPEPRDGMGHLGLGEDQETRSKVVALPKEDDDERSEPEYSEDGLVQREEN